MKVAVAGWIVFWFMFFMVSYFLAGHNTTFQSQRKTMRKHLQLMACLMLLSLVVFSHTSVYAHDNDDDCPDCDGSGQLSPGCSHCDRVRSPSLGEWIGSLITDVVP